jgi:hypothetical protein
VFSQPVQVIPSIERDTVLIVTAFVADCAALSVAVDFPEQPLIKADTRMANMSFFMILNLKPKSKYFTIAKTFIARIIEQ